MVAFGTTCMGEVARGTWEEFSPSGWRGYAGGGLEAYGATNPTKIACGGRHPGVS